jgi:hypothetical protein
MAKLNTPEIPPCPPAGEGVHRWLMEAAWACRKAELTPDAAALERNTTHKALA